jgi:formyltetrahydrofolate synthetase
VQLVSQPGPFDSVGDLAEEPGLLPDEVESYGRLVCVTAMTPTKFGEGKTTTAISLADGLGRPGPWAWTAASCVARRTCPDGRISGLR